MENNFKRWDHGRSYVIELECHRAIQAYKQEQCDIWNKATWGEIDDEKLARYLAGECTEWERQIVEQAISSYPKLAECIQFIQKVMNG
jgi:hypothetical protein